RRIGRAAPPQRAPGCGRSSTPPHPRNRRCRSAPSLSDSARGRSPAARLGRGAAVTRGRPGGARRAASWPVHDEAVPPSAGIDADPLAAALLAELRVEVVELLVVGRLTGGRFLPRWR